MPKQHSVYSNCNPQLSGLFDQVAPAKLLCVALDYAKAAHTALICNGKGDLLKPPFVLENTAEGARKLLTQVEKCARQQRISLEHVFFAGEDDPFFCGEFCPGLAPEKVFGHPSQRLGSQAAAEQFSSFERSFGFIGNCPVLFESARGNGAGSCSRLRQSAECDAAEREELVRARTAASNRIHPYVDRLFPGFLDAAQRAGLCRSAERVWS